MVDLLVVKPGSFSQGRDWNQFLHQSCNGHTETATVLPGPTARSRLYMFKTFNQQGKKLKSVMICELTLCTAITRSRSLSKPQDSAQHHPWKFEGGKASM